jgi:hypothetical protein
MLSFLNELINILENDKTSLLEIIKIILPEDYKKEYLSINSNNNKSNLLHILEFILILDQPHLGSNSNINYNNQLYNEQYISQRKDALEYIIFKSLHIIQGFELLLRSRIALGLVVPVVHSNNNNSNSNIHKGGSGSGVSPLLDGHEIKKVNLYYI